MTPKRQHKEKRERCNLRLPTIVLRSIDSTRSKRPGVLSRNSWIAEAIRDKLTSEGIKLPPDAWGAANDA
ncbi:MAG TPA: hypothetical protein VGK90_14165 [Rhizomicrobium sp.]|jgi:metal-responsive CopG/Arc/MetJ family transcriptional regulator